MTIQVAFDAADPHALCDFWAQVLGYRVEDHHDFVNQLVSSGPLPEAGRIHRRGRAAFRDVATAVDPEGKRPRLFFQRVPEPKTAKNRVHLDISVPSDQHEAEVARLEGMGARVLWGTSDRGPLTTTMADPEGNEFCLH